MQEPSITETAFDCPHCGAYTTQFWYDSYIKRVSEESKTPFRPRPDFEKWYTKELQKGEEIAPEAVIKKIRKLLTGAVFANKETTDLYAYQLNNVSVSSCYNCKKFALWVDDGLIYPAKKYGEHPNEDLPENVSAVVDEARSIIDLSPKGAAALLRLAIQLLVIDLGESGTNLNSDIGSLVQKGLDVKIQRALDIVRVIGNESVHPGVIDLNDDKDTALELFGLINLICDQMISQPKRIDNLYGKLPETKRAEIEKRDAKKDPK